MKDLLASYLSGSLSRRSFLSSLASAGVSLAAAESVVQSLASVAHADEGTPAAPPDKTRIFKGTGGAAFAEQLIACGVKYVFGNSASEDASFYEALVDRPQLHYILSPHEGPGTAMAAGYAKASREPTIVMTSGIVGLSNAIGQIYNAYKEQTPLVFYSYRREASKISGRDAFEEVAEQEQIVAPLTKWHWLARGPEQIPETVRRAFKVAWTPPLGPTYGSWHSDYNNATVKTEIIVQERMDLHMRIRPNAVEVERAAKVLLDAKMPLMIVGDEVYRGGEGSLRAAIKLAELLGMPVTQLRSVYSNFPESHTMWVGEAPTGTLMSLSYPKEPDVVLSVGDRLSQFSTTPIVPKGAKLIDLSIDSMRIGTAIPTDVPLVADVQNGLEDIITAVNSAMTAKARTRIRSRAQEVHAFSDKARVLATYVAKNPQWENSPLVSDRVTYEIAQFADRDALIISEGSRAVRTMSFNPLGGRELFRNAGSHLGSGVGTAAGVKLARPRQQVICLVGDGSFVFGPTALWNMARLELPVIVVVYNNHAYDGPHNRVVGHLPDGRMMQTGKFVHDYLGSPDMDMSAIARGFGVAGEVVSSPVQLKEALQRAKKSERNGKPYLIDAQVAREGAGWAEKPWVPPNAREGKG